MLSDKGITFINQKQEEVKDKEENKTNKSEENEKDEDKTNKTENNVKNETKNNNSSSNTNSNTNTQTSTETIWYTSNVFKIKLPKSWENKYVVEMADGGNGEGDVDKLTYDENENVIHAYPIGKSFVNNIARDVEEIVFENIN